jgi:translation initiation factor 4G
LLNKLTPNNVDFIAGEIITQANKSYTQTDGCSLKEFTRIILDKAIDDSTWSAHYARLCRKIMDHISPQLQDENIKDSDGMPIAGGRLFRMNLLKCCQEDFACGWVCNGDAIVATKAKDDAISSPVPTGDKETNASVPNSSDERDAFTKAKRQGMSLIKLAGELFKLQMFPERAMHMCIKRLLQNIESPEEEEIVSVCGLLTSVGELLDTTRGSSDMDVYFMRMHKLVHNARVNSRMQYLLLVCLTL